MNVANIFSLFFVVGISACGGGNESKNSSAPLIPLPIPEEISLCQSVGCEDNNKLVIVQIYTDIINGLNTGLVANLYDENFIQHNADISSGIDGQEAYFKKLAEDYPNHVATIKHIVADSDYVAVHWHFSTDAENEFTGTARIDLFKLVDNMVIEQWSSIMIPKTFTVSGNSVFSDLYDYQDTQPNNDVATEDENKDKVTSFYLDLFNNKNIALIDEFVDPNYIQHNFWVDNGSSALRDFVANRDAASLTIFLSLAEDDLVWTFSGTGNANLNTVDLWRVDNNKNKIVEHWDVF